MTHLHDGHPSASPAASHPETRGFPLGEECVLGLMLEARAKANPDKVFAIFEDGATWTYAQALEEVRTTAGALRDLGVREGELVGIWLPNGKPALRVWWAINYLGAVAVPINTAYKGALIEHVLRDSAVSLLVAHHELVPRLDAVEHEALRTVVVLGGRVTPEARGAETVPAERLWASDTTPLARAADRKPWDLELIVYTSGTTGPSKGVMMPYFQIHQAMLTYQWLSADDRFLINLPLFHVSGLGAALVPLQYGASFAMVADFSTTTFWDVVRRYDCTAVLLMGVMATFLMKATPSPRDRDHPLRLVQMVPLAEDAQAFHERFGVDVYTCFNMTEISSPLLAGPQPSPIGSCGRLRPGIEARIVDEHDLDVPEGETGELILRSELPWAMMSGYLNRPDATAEVWRNGWFHTGDVFRRDETGAYFFVDRVKDALRRRGENISSYELEAEVCRHPAVREAAAIAVPSPVGEDDVMVVVAPVPGVEIDPEDLLRQLVDQLPHFMVPRYVRVVPDLPKTPTAKVQKHLLRSEGAVEGTYDREATGFKVARQRLSR
ncbi:AMP-binding protein [Nocardioides albus]|uniref:Crotonobetaine/carnitine-CoA ligase n=1 Tax=Nocardioides albus TaxID=1841 RepID=A0A7W5A3U7_9ACTN|nr:AMP-binding protein [Nocardioides albus]MBB3088983.1 crotonobetaine/carnitine-CoA ligase [Nocardioides albus]GGU15024.1 ATP-dependent acyl-CoA ligase [Nocardioides albus]